MAALMRAFVAWHYRRHALDREMIDSYFDPEDFEKELRNLPGEFAPPAGALLVAEQGGRIAGCVALKPLGEGACEMKRMFVAPDCHGKGLGLQLGRAIVDEARRIGYRKILLDTGPAQREAQGLYRKLGFSKVEPYQDLPPRLREWLVFMELDLRP
ncbi:MAG: GNAT family N-acetyltransferase [Pararhodobacter sp.]|nr:GNAT family N-acetyltransferase [Pararhodobacter sp.]